ncbi:serine/threonine protein kinase [Fusarium flagelliforme]|uniref:Serine/threonine protein kinase n=1 Tax=Fusarium flagelliforme TaxID=2675880 RepID=A0A395MCK2_9HYPO|nr:serine/threonine protein kinase [Fusarium flagelliforme]
MGEPSNHHQPGLTNRNSESPYTQQNNALPKRPVSQIIANEIRRAILPSPDFHKGPEAFVLECSLKEILNPERVQDVLDEIHDHHPDRPTISIDAIFDTSRGTGRLKILATLISLKKTKRLYDFIESNVWDEDLPVTDSSDVFKRWSETTCDGFVAKQYLFLAPVIDFECMEHKLFHSSIRMPFLNPLVDARKGAQGEVYKVRIHRDYQRWGERIRCDDHYAVKRFTADLISFNQEREALLRFSHPNTGHESLIQLLYSYELRSTKYLIFPCAESDLEYHWANHKADPTSREDLIWMLQQCHGIASGLERVHNNPSFRVGDISGSRSRGRHGDIKPRNILFFKDEKKPPGRLVVADFTLMRFHSSNADYTQIQNIGFSATYRPPEKAAGEGTQVSQKYDIWTLGCVFLEFISWHLLGPAAVRPRKEGYERGFLAPDGKVREDFGTSRQRDDDAMAGCRDDKFFNINNWTHAPTAVVKSSVLEWINYLHHHQSSSPALHAFLDLIQLNMLLARPEDRCSMLHVTTAMGKILHTAKTMPTYCKPLQKPNPTVTDSFPHLLRSSDWYWPSVDLPPPQSFTTDPHNSDYNVLANIILSPDPKSSKSEGELEVKRGGSSLGRPSNSFRTGSPGVSRESVEYAFCVGPGES